MPFYIQNTETQLVLDVKGGEEGGEAQVIMFAYHGSANQLWEYKNGMIYSKLNGCVLTPCAQAHRLEGMNVYTECFKERFTTLKEYINLYRGHTQRF
jgi:hypothetical protein